MKLDTNNKVVNYNSCSTAGETFNGQADTYISSEGGSGQFTIILNKPPGSLKTGQVFEAQSIKSLATDNCATFNYVPTSNSDDVYGYPSSEFQPVGSVTLTEVTSTDIKGTFSAEIFYTSDGTDLLYTITNGTFCSGPSAYTVNFIGN